MNTDITQRPPVTNVTDSDEFEVQVPGETVTKKATRKQITQIEETARIAEDTTIKLSTGLYANGGFPTLPFSNYLKLADFTTAILEPNVVSALKILDAQLFSWSSFIAQGIRFQSIVCSAADILSSNAVPKVLIAGVPNYAIEVMSIVGIFNFNTAVYINANNALLFQYIVSNTNIGNFPFDLLVSNSDWNYKAILTNGIGMPVGEGVEMTCASAPTSGNSPLIINITYKQHYIAP